MFSKLHTDNLRMFISSGANLENFHRSFPVSLLLQIFFPRTGAFIILFVLLIQKPELSVDCDPILLPNTDFLEALWRDHLISRLAAERIDEVSKIVLI